MAAQEKPMGSGMLRQLDFDETGEVLTRKLGLATYHC